MPNDNIERIIKKAAGEGDGSNYEDIVYEGYGPSGVAVVVEALTDNRNRTAGDLRHYFDKFGGNMGQPGSVMFMFNRQGVITIDAEGLDEDTVMEAALEAGADDFIAEDDAFVVNTSVQNFSTVRKYLEDKGLNFFEAQVTMVPQNKITLSGDDLSKFTRMVDALEDLDDVQNVYHNVDLPDEF